MRLTRLAGRRPHQLSGGEQQRVALARALVCEPSVLLLDEPFGALDAKLRKALRTELTALQREVGTTFVFVTHDQEEALEMSDRLAVMDGGRVVQCGRPKDVYEAPGTEFVADFLGLANLLDVTCLELDGGGTGAGPARRVRPDRYLYRTRPARRGPGRDPPGAGTAASPGATGANTVPAIVDNLVYVGATTQVIARLPHGPAVQVLVVNDSDRDDLRPGAPVVAHAAGRRAAPARSGATSGRAALALDALTGRPTSL